MERAVGHLNELNRRYASGEASYDYSLYYDNCVRALHDSLAAAGVWEPVQERSRFLGQVFQMKVPANELGQLSERITGFPFDDSEAVRKDAAASASLRAFGWLPTRHGALLESAPVHRPNELYDTSLQMFVVEGPGERATGRFRELATDARFTQLEPNLLYYEERYRRILAQPQGAGWWPRSAEDEAMRARYRAYVAAQLAEVRDLIGRLPGYDGR
jgi:hypothetical protein